MKAVFFGYGKTTRAIAKRFGGEFDFFDDRCQKSWIDEDGNRIFPSSKFNPNESDLEILTPSINPDNPLLKLAKNPVSEYDLFLKAENIKDIKHSRFSSLLDTPKPKTIWVSGTNGKTTTTQMITYLLSDRGALSGGNIGTPLAQLDPSAPLWILETSSFTLHHTKWAKPDIYILLPITPDHINWHGSKEAYAKDKLSPLSRMQEGELALIPSNLEDIKSTAWVVKYKNSKFLADFFNIDSSKLRYKSAFLEDALLSLSVTRTLFDEVDYEKMNNFGIDAHRQQEIKDYRGRLWVNDSKATNLDATLKAIETYGDKKLHIIIGGDDKGVDMEPLIKQLSSLECEIYTIGSNSDKLSKLADKYNLPNHNLKSLEKAIKSIDSNMKDNEIALLSPAASSLDQFSSYAQRGDIFMEKVKSLS